MILNIPSFLCFLDPGDVLPLWPVPFESSLCYFLLVYASGQVTQDLSFHTLNMGTLWVLSTATGTVLAAIIM